MALGVVKNTAFKGLIIYDRRTEVRATVKLYAGELPAMKSRDKLFRCYNTRARISTYRSISREVRAIYPSPFSPVREN